MKVSELIQELERYQKIHGDDEVEFWVEEVDGLSFEEATLKEVHDGYSDTGRECEIRVKLK